MIKKSIDLILGSVMLWVMSTIQATDGVKRDSIVVGGGCFWCLEAQFLLIKGVTKVESGYAGGAVKNPTYEQVCGGSTGHAEVVRVEFDPALVSIDQLLRLFWDMHDPTTLNRQGHDVGTQYRSCIFFSDAEQEKKAKDSVAKAQVNYTQPIVTQVAALDTFYVAEEYHQNYFARNPDKAYCMRVVAPKVSHFKEKNEADLKKP
jgi:peptide-methionine (S)-S-oxide reductase